MFETIYFDQIYYFVGLSCSLYSFEAIYGDGRTLLLYLTDSLSES